MSSPPCSTGTITTIFCLLIVPGTYLFMLGIRVVLYCLYFLLTLILLVSYFLLTYFLPYCFCQTIGKLENRAQVNWAMCSMPFFVSFLGFYFIFFLMSSDSENWFFDFFYESLEKKQKKSTAFTCTEIQADEELHRPPRNFILTRPVLSTNHSSSVKRELSALFSTKELWRSDLFARLWLYMQCSATCYLVLPASWTKLKD